MVQMMADVLRHPVVEGDKDICISEKEGVMVVDHLQGVIVPGVGQFVSCTPE